MKRAASEELTTALEDAQQGDEMAVYKALAAYEQRLFDWRFTDIVL